MRAAPGAPGAVVEGLRRATPWMLVVATSFLAAATATGKTEIWVGRTLSLLVVGGLVGAALLAVFAMLRSFALLAWAPLAVAMYAIIRVPRDAPIITFDRLWIVALLGYLAVESRRVPRARSTQFLAFALLWLGVSYGIRAISTSPGLSLPVMTWIDAIGLPVIAFFAARQYTLTRERMERLAGSLMIAGGILGAIGVAERIFGFELATYAGGTVRFDEEVGATRISGPYPVPEPYALTLIICLAATLYLLQTRKHAVQIWAVAFASLEIGGIALTLFRAAWLGAVVVVIASFGFRRRSPARAAVVASFVIALAVAVIIPLEENKTFSTRAKDTNNIYGRIATYEQGLEIFRSAPLVGVGVHEYHSVAQGWRPVYEKNVKAIDFPHSSYIGLLAEQGIVGFTPFLFVSLGVWRMLRTSRRVADSEEADVLTACVTGAALGYLIMSLTLTMLPYGPSNAFLAVVLGAACGRLDAFTSSGSGAEHGARQA